MAEDAANLIAETSAATADALTKALSGFRLGSTPSVRLSKFVAILIK